MKPLVKHVLLISVLTIVAITLFLFQINKKNQELKKLVNELKTENSELKEEIKEKNESLISLEKDLQVLMKKVTPQRYSP